MARKKRALKAEVVDEGGNVNLTGTTRLEFALNKTDIIDFYCADEEDKLEAEISIATKSLADLDKEISGLEKPIISDIEITILKQHKKLIDKTKRAILTADRVENEFASLGRENSGEWASSRSAQTAANLKATIRLCVDEYPRGAGVHPWEINANGRKTLKGLRRALGRNVPESRLHDLNLNSRFWLEYSHTFKTRDQVVCQITIGRNRTGLLEFPLKGKLKDQIDFVVTKKNSRGSLVKKLHDLLIRHSEMPQFKKQIKKQVVGRVLKNTDQGKLLLRALKGIRKNSAKLLTDASSES